MILEAKEVGWPGGTVYTREDHRMIKAVKEAGVTCWRCV